MSVLNSFMNPEFTSSDEASITLVFRFLIYCDGRSILLIEKNTVYTTRCQKNGQE